MLRTSLHGGDPLWAAVLQTESTPCQGGPWAGAKFTVTTAAAHNGAVGRHHEVIYLSTNPLGISPGPYGAVTCPAPGVQVLWAPRLCPTAEEDV